MENCSAENVLGGTEPRLSRWLRDQMYRTAWILALIAIYFPTNALAQECTTRNVVLINSGGVRISEFYVYSDPLNKGPNRLGSSGLRAAESVNFDIRPGTIYDVELVWNDARGARRLLRSGLEFCRINTIYFAGGYFDGADPADRNFVRDLFTSLSVSRRCAEPRRSLNVGNLTSHKIEEFYIYPSSSRPNADNRRNSISINAKSDTRIMLPSAPYFDITIIFRIDNALHRFERRNVPICNVPSTVMFIDDLERLRDSPIQERFSIEFQSPVP
jgi:hypothetical protein